MDAQHEFSNTQSFSNPACGIVPLIEDVTCQDWDLRRIVAVVGRHENLPVPELCDETKRVRVIVFQSADTTLRNTLESPYLCSRTLSQGDPFDPVQL